MTPGKKEDKANHMDEKEALIHVLLMCEQYQTRVQWEITAPIVIDSLQEDGRITSELHDFLHNRVKSKTIHEFLPYLKAYRDAQKALAESFNDLKNRRGRAQPTVKLYQSKTAKAKGFLKIDK